MENNLTIINNNASFSENYVREKKEELALGILKLFNINSFDETLVKAIKHHAVSTHVNNPTNNDSKCVFPVKD